jgi:hypothetical protein
VPAITTPSVKIAADGHHRLAGAGETRFSLARTRNLQFRLQLPARTIDNGVTWATMKLYTPNGALYHTRHIPYSTNRGLGEVPSPHGVSHPIRVVPVEQIPGGLGLDVGFLVAGTNINRYPLPGMWKVVIEVDGKPELRAEQTFELGSVKK